MKSSPTSLSHHKSPPLGLPGGLLLTETFAPPPPPPPDAPCAPCAPWAPAAAVAPWAPVEPVAPWAPAAPAAPWAPVPDVMVIVFSAPFPVAATPFPTKFNVVACVDKADPSSLTVTPDVKAAPSWVKLPVKFILPPTSRWYWATVVPIPTLPDVKDILYAVVP